MLMGWTVNNPTIDIIVIVEITADFLLSLNSSVRKATGTSTNESIAIVAANDVNKKNKIINKLPKGILENTKGMVLKSKEGPEVGSNPKVNTTGNIAKPIVKDTNVSDSTTLKALFIILLSSVI